MLESCWTYLGETCGFPRDPEPVYGAPMCCGNGSYSINLSSTLPLARIPQLTQPAAGYKMWNSP